MNQNLVEMSNTELKAYIKANRNNAEICHQALMVILSRTSSNTRKYPSDLSDRELEAIFREKLNQREE